MRLVSINVERSKHLDKVIPFLKRLNPDVVCVQELLQRDIPLFAQVTKGSHVWAPNCAHHPDPPDLEPQIMGSGIFAKGHACTSDVRYYCGSWPSAMSFPAKEYVEDHCLVCLDVVANDGTYRFMTTHFTWSHGGEATDLQRENIKNLQRLLEQFGDFILTGDFNAPRGGEIFRELSSRYKDNVPACYQTSIDVNLHRAGKVRPRELSDKMVDGLFTTPAYAATNVELVFGISDHAAIVADIHKI